MRPFPLDDLGASSHRASSQGWTAVAHPHADAIRLTGPDGRTVTLLCPSPFRVAWAGSSLVVGTLTLELWRFPRVIETFECLGATLPVSIGTWPA